MTRFDPNKQHKSAIDWSAIAFQTADDDFAAETVVVGAVVGTAIASVTTPILGGVIACYFIIKGVQKTINADKNRKVIRETGCIAHILTDANFRAYKHQVGSEAVIKELQFAQENGLTFSDDALDFYEDYLDYIERLSAGTTQAPSQEPDNTILVTARKPVVDVYNPPRPEDFNLPDRMGKDATSHIIVGVPGAGKGLLTSNALVAIKKHHPEITIFYIDPKNDPKESGYFTDRVDYIRRANIQLLTPSATVEWFKDSIKRFEEVAGDKLLVFDESTLVSSKFKLAKELDWIKDKLISYASAGDSLGLRIWIIAQNAHTDDLGINGGIRSQFVPIAIISRKNLAALGALFSTKFIPQNQKIDVDEVEIITNQSPVARAVYHGGENKWFPMKRLPNPSGYDRDSRQFVEGIVQIKNIDDTQKIAEIKTEETKNLTEPEQLLLTWIKTRKSLKEDYDLNTANKNLERIAKPDSFTSKAEYLRHLARQLETKNKGNLINPNQFEPN